MSSAERALRCCSERPDDLTCSTCNLSQYLATITDSMAWSRYLRDTWADTTTPQSRLMPTVLGGDPAWRCPEDAIALFVSRPQPTKLVGEPAEMELRNIMVELGCDHRWPRSSSRSSNILPDGRISRKSSRTSGHIVPRSWRDGPRTARASGLANRSNPKQKMLRCYLLFPHHWLTPIVIAKDA